MHRRTITLLATPFAALLAIAPLSACSDDTEEDVRDTAESVQEDVEEGVDQAAARSTAEALRASLKGNDTADQEGMRSVAAIEEAAEDLPGDPTVNGIEDTDGDGLDDDGRVEIESGGDQACLTIPEEGEDAEVENGACAT
ncbi:MAG TPA: hypothetical protein VHK88_10425 [Aquihabitans sp.]|jgi:hypothetical protein|nr:hypothetical protein [Aquihabitans sp.]